MVEMNKTFRELFLWRLEIYQTVVVWDMQEKSIPLRTLKIHYFIKKILTYECGVYFVFVLCSVCNLYELKQTACFGFEAKSNIIDLLCNWNIKWRRKHDDKSTIKGHEIYTNGDIFRLFFYNIWCSKLNIKYYTGTSETTTAAWDVSSG